MINSKSQSGSYRVLKSLSFCGLALAFALGSAASYAAPAFNKVFFPNTIGTGSTTSLLFSITNDASSLSSLSFSDTLPAGLVIANHANAVESCNGSISASPGGTTISLNDGRLAAFQSCQVSVNVTGTFPGTYTNVSGDLTSTSGNSGNAVAELNIGSTRPGFSKAFTPSAISLGDRSTLTFSIDNSLNPAQSFALAFSDNLPSGMVVADPANIMTTCGDGTITANAGSSNISLSVLGALGAVVPPGSTCSVAVDVLATGGGSLLNTSSELSSNFQNVSSGFAVAELNVDVSTVHLSKAFIDDPVAPGGTVELRFNITNRDRSGNATEIAFTDDLGSILAGLVATGLPANDVCGSGSNIDGTDTLSLTGGNLAPNESCSFSVAVQVPSTATAGAYTNLTSVLTANISGSPFTGNMASDTLFVDVGPTLSKSFQSNPVGAGDTVTIEFTVTNGSSTEAASAISFVDNISQFISSATVASVPTSDPCGTGSNVSSVNLATEVFGIQLTNGSLAAGDSCTFTADILVSQETAGAVYTNITDEVIATIGGTVRIGNPAEASLTVVEAPVLEKQFINDPVNPGDVVTLEFTLSTNSESASSAATAITFSDDLNATLSGLVATGLPLVDICGVGSELSGSSAISFTGGDLGVGESCTFSVDLAVPTTALPGNYENRTSVVSATVGGISTSNEPAVDTLTVGGLEITKSFATSPVIAGDSVALEFTISNSGNLLEATNISVSDDLDDFINGAVEGGLLPMPDVCGAGSLLSATSGGSIIILQNGVLAAGQSCTFGFDVVIPATTEDDFFTNRTSNLQATVDGNVLSLDPATAALEVSSNLIGLSKNFSTAVISLGASATLNFEVSNLSATEAISDIAFTDDLDAALSGLTATGSSIPDLCGTGSLLSGSNLLTFSGGSLAPNTSCSFSVGLSTPSVAPGINSITNTTSSSTGLVGNLSVSGTPASASAIVVDVDFSKSFNSPAVAGELTTLSFNIQNNGARTLTRLFFTDDLAAVLSGMQATGLPINNVCGTGSMISGSSVITLFNGGLTPGQACQFSVDVMIPAATASGAYQNITSTLLADGQFVVSAPATASLDVLTRSATFSKSFDGVVEAGLTTNLNFVIENTGTLDLSQLSFSDDLNAVVAGLVASGSPLNDVCGVGSSLTGTSVISLSGANLVAGDTCQFAVAVTVPSSTAAGDYINTTSDLSESGSTLTEPATATLTVTAAPTGKVTICHKPGTKAEKTKEVPQSAVNGHLGHGDYLGACASSAGYISTIGSGNANNHADVEATSTSITATGAGAVTASPQTSNGRSSGSTLGLFSNWGTAIATSKSTSNQGNDSNTLCHYSTIFGHQSIDVAARQIERHVAHGDTRGACSK